jgi:ketosteroid isomerase-like protein
MNTTRYATPEEAEQAFYDAFEAADVNAMMDVWAPRDFVECIHPMSDRVQGTDSIAASWREIFSSGFRVRIRRTDIHRTQDALLAIHVLYEYLSISGGKEQMAPVIATNIYQLIAGSWRMVLHHASPAARGESERQQRTPGSSRDQHQLH